ncbi:hypothetical protein Y590_08195 [Methylobacterium sp. AMS5]|nr:hypothetical protein Y590_08195 [Methylobacterium sp. AMS5]
MPMEPIDDNQRFGRFLGMGIDAPVWRQSHADPALPGSVP